MNGTDDLNQPPAFQPLHSIELTSTQDSKILGVSVYSGRAEITRLFKFTVKTGQNQVTINGLPSVLDQASLRVEGRGAATIHDVTISYIPQPPPPSTSPALSTLLTKKDRTSKAIERCKKSISSLESYLATMHIQHIHVNQLGSVVKAYDATGEELDNRLLELEKELENIDEEITAEHEKLSGTPFNHRLNIRAAVGVFAELEGEVEIVLIYAVMGATWSAGYDIRVDMQTKEEAVTLIYKSAITQDTGEDWNDIPLTLETATPTFGLAVPTLEPWNLSIQRPAPPPIPAPPPVIIHPQSAISQDMIPTSARRYRSRAQKSEIAHRGLEVSSSGNISATFQVPGLITIPSDGVAHNVTIVRLKLNATMSWVCVPKKDTKTRLSAKIKNASQYTLLRGIGSVYVDGSFISRSEVPSVSPEESFNCPLGLDPSIRVTYHPAVKKLSQSGFYTKTAHHVFSQNITVHNTKSTPIDGVRIIDQIPVSEDSQIQVNLVQPTLSNPNANTTNEFISKPVTVSKGIVALWDGADEPEADKGVLGKNGKFNWVCSIPPQGKVNLFLQWEVVVPARTDIVGLMLAVCYP